jgi:hypothetical protein
VHKNWSIGWVRVRIVYPKKAGYVSALKQRASMKACSKNRAIKSMRHKSYNKIIQQSIQHKSYSKNHTAKATTTKTKHTSSTHL